MSKRTLSQKRTTARLRKRALTDYSAHVEVNNTVGNVTNLMCANRGVIYYTNIDSIVDRKNDEIAIRVFRTAHELGLRTTAVFAFEDRLNMHRYKADEAYQIGEEGQFTPVGAYLAMDALIDIAKKRCVDVIHPGYGFLSENAVFARKVEAAGMKWVGPTPDSIDRMGDKTSARALATEAGIPIVPGSDAIRDVADAFAFVKKYGLPVILKAAMGGGGRGMRVVRKEEELESAYERAGSEALSAFGDGTIFIERFLVRPRHIEVQILGDGQGNVIHLFERDCSVQRRHQKVIELAPANLPIPVRDRILADAVKIAKHVNYRNAGTAEFLVDAEHRHFFIEVNPRIQVKHTVTEEITGIDIVAAQIRIAAGASLPQLGLTQESIVIRGNAIQCRVTTEDPENSFAPDTGRIELYRSVGGNGVRLDGANVYSGVEISPHYDSLLVKVTCHGETFEIARRKVLRALAEFRIRGVKTNIPFLQKLAQHETFIAGRTWTTFIDDAPELFQMVSSKNRVQKLLTYLAESIVNGSSIKGQNGPPGNIIPVVPALSGYSADETNEPCVKGWRRIFLDQGPDAFAKAVRAHSGTLITDTTWRDAHQSLLATRVRTIDLKNIATTTSWALQNAFSVECWGGATFDVSLRFLSECPWDRLRILRKLCPAVPFQMLLRGANAVGYTSYPDNVIYEFCVKARQEGVDVFRVFDSLNFFENLELGIDAVIKAGGICEGCICYTGDVSDPSKTKYNLEYYLDFVDKLVKAGVHLLGIKDMAGLLKPRAARILVSAIREKYPNLPIHMHTHDTAGTGVASMIAAAESGADVIDLAVDSMSGITSQPSMGAVVASLSESKYETGIKLDHVQALSGYWQQIRLLYQCFDPKVSSTSSDVYLHEMPGGQYTNLLFQATSLGLGTQWEEIKTAYAEANSLCGDIVKVTPSSKVVGDLAQFMVSNKLDKPKVLATASTLSFPTSVVEYFQGYLGQPHGGFPEPLRSQIIKNLPKIDGRPGASWPPADLQKTLIDLKKKYGDDIRDVDVLSYILYPFVFEEYKKANENYGDLSILPTIYFLGGLQLEQEIAVDLEEGKTLFIELSAIAAVHTKTGMRDVIFQVNGESRRVSILDRTSAVDTVTRPKADKSQYGHIGSPMTGVIIELRCREGDEVAAGDPICVLSAMKMETLVTTPVPGVVGSIEVILGDSLASGDLIAVITKQI